MIESSNAVKCPSMAGLLTTFKKFQQIFSDEEILTKYLPQEDLRNTVRPLFQDMFDLNERNKPHVEHAIKDAIEKPHMYVLKPQKEGGGNNIFGD